MEAAAYLALVSVLLRVLPFRLVMRLTRSHVAVDPPIGLSTVDVDRAVSAAVRSAARKLRWQPACLEQAIAASLMMKRRGRRGELCFGVAMADGTLRAHAWLTLDGAIVCGGRVASRFAPLLPTSGGPTNERTKDDSYGADKGV